MADTLVSKASAERRESSSLSFDTKKGHKVCCQLAGEVELINITWIVVNVKSKKIQKEKNQKMATLCLGLCLFFNPAGFDILFKTILDATGSYWITTGIFYLVAASFLGLYFYFSRLNPFIEIYLWHKNFFNKLKNIVTKRN